VVRAAHMVYGWMPTALDLYCTKGEEDLMSAAKILSAAKQGSVLGSAELQTLAGLVNRTLVGASKLLHFAAPARLPIWDSKVYRFVHEKRSHHFRLNSVTSYLEYIDVVTGLIASGSFDSFHRSIQTKLGYNVSPVR